MNRRSIPWAALGAALILPSIAGAQAGDMLEEVVVTARLRETPVQALPASVTILSGETIESAGLQHFADVMPLVPNLNWSAGTSRPRYLQIRGIGELEQYQGAPNPSVAFLIDDIDFSGVGMPATTFDVEQIEVLRGPQGTSRGANALAGLVSIRSRAPRRTHEFEGELTMGDHGAFGAGAVLGGPIGGDTAAWRLVAQHYGSDGFRENAYLGRDDTNGYDENTFRARIAGQPANHLALDFTAMHVDLDNGFDAFAIDNSRTTLSDHPGPDAQRSAAAALRAEWSGAEAFTVRGVFTWGDSDIDYGFDGDWGNDRDWGEYAPYDYTSLFRRERRAWSADLRLLSKEQAQQAGELSWVAGAYALDVHETNDQVDTASGEPYRQLASDYTAVNTALYGELDWRASARILTSIGLRLERRDADYEDFERIAQTSSAFSPTEDLWGGHLSATFEQSATRSGYLTVSRGYKAGGFNIGPVVPEERKVYSAETLWNYEAGLDVRSEDGSRSWRTSLFYMRRSQQQVQTSIQLIANDPLSYVFFTANAASGENYGLESTFAWALTPRWNLGATLGLLESAYLGYDTGDPVRDQALEGRAQAHAPKYQYSVSAEYRHPRGWFGRADLQGVDAFYFDTSHDERSEPYTLVNLRLGYAAGRWTVSAWARNLFDESYAMRGFYFQNEPPDFPFRRYVQLADGRQLGVTLNYRFD